MATVKTLLDKRRKSADDIYPIVVRITHLRQFRKLGVGYSVSLKHWDSTSGLVHDRCKEASIINVAIHQTSAKLFKYIGELSAKGDYTLPMIVELYQGRRLPQGTTVATHSLRIVSDLTVVGKVGNANVYETAANRFSAYCGDVTYDKVTYEVLLGFEGSSNIPCGVNIY